MEGNACSLGLALGVFLAAAFLTGAYYRYALARQLLDRPNERSSHINPMPTGGGVVFVSIFLMLLLYAYVRAELPIAVFWGLIGGAGVVAVVGCLDDRRHIAPAWRLVVQMIAALWFVCWSSAGSGWGHDSGWALGLLWGMGAALTLVGGTNLYNFMDGIDGLAGIEAVSVAIGSAMILWSNGVMTYAPVLLCLAAVVAGFLVWNWPPARVFMGDTGSGFLGFLLGAMVILTVGDGGITLWSWAILLGVFIVDATVTLLRRMLHGERWYEAHRTHAYQHAARRWGSHRRVTIAVLIINVLWLWPLAWLVSQIQQPGVILTTLALTPLVVLCLWLGAGQAEKSELIGS